MFYDTTKYVTKIFLLIFSVKFTIFKIYFTLENTSVFTSSKVFVLKYAHDATIAALSVQYFIGGAKTL